MKRRSCHIRCSSLPVIGEKRLARLRKSACLFNRSLPTRKTVEIGGSPARKAENRKRNARRKGVPSFFAPGSDGGRCPRLFGGFPAGLSEKRRAYEKTIAPHLALFPSSLSEKRRPCFFFLLFALSVQNAPATRPKPPLSPGIRRRRGQNRPFLPEYAGDMVENEPFLPEYAGGAAKKVPCARNVRRRG